MPHALKPLAFDPAKPNGPPGKLIVSRRSAACLDAMALRATMILKALLACAALIAPLAHAADLAGHKVVSLVASSGKKHEIADIDLRPRYGGYGFELTFRRDAFKEIFMQENNFLCLPGARRDVCHFPYPPGDYTPDDSSGFFTESDPRGLEYALLFAHKRPAPAEIDINPFNGLYYRLKVVGTRVEGTVYGVDFKRLVVADDKDKYPLKSDDLDTVELADEPFPHLLIE